jgi:hypothetical protein
MGYFMMFLVSAICIEANDRMINEMVEWQGFGR